MFAIWLVDQPIFWVSTGFNCFGWYGLIWLNLDSTATKTIRKVVWDLFDGCGCAVIHTSALLLAAGRKASEICWSNSGHLASQWRGKWKMAKPQSPVITQHKGIWVESYIQATLTWRNPHSLHLRVPTCSKQFELLQRCRGLGPRLSHRGPRSKQLETKHMNPLSIGNAENCIKQYQLSNIYKKHVTNNWLNQESDERNNTGPPKEWLILGGFRFRVQGLGI